MILIDKDRCIRCGGCVSVCPVSALTLTEHGLSCSDTCINCESCVKFCPVDALKLSTKNNETGV